MKRSGFVKGLILGLSLSILMTVLYLQARTKAEPVTGAASTEMNSRELRRSPVVEAAEKASPAVVSIGATRIVYTSRAINTYFYNFIAPHMMDPSPKKLKFPYLGSGFLIDNDGHVVTNYHVVEGASEIFITLVDGREYKAKILDADVPVDVALLKIIDGKDLPVVKLGDSDDLMIGETVLAIGNPFGNVLKDPNPTITQGVISAVDRSFRSEINSKDARTYHDMIQTDAPINPGNSGGPLVNILGEVIGVNTFIISETGASHGLGFAIPINRVKAVVDEIKTYGRIRNIWRDFDVIDLHRQIREALNTKVQNGAVVRVINRLGPAYEAGLRVEDIITAVDDDPVNGRNDLYSNLRIRRVGETVTLHINRAGKELELKYTLVETPKNEN